ncbi:Hsp70 family protein [Rhizocola hellebori]|nr:Hsp70 family protein [Rhizocola hellebori]
MSGQVFISFSHEHDAGYAARLAAHLAAAGVAARYDTQPMSENWWETYTRAQVDSCTAVIVVMTPEAQVSGWVGREVDRARAQGKPIAALLLRGESFVPGVEFEDVRDGSMPGPQLVERFTAGEPAAERAGASVLVRAGALGLAVGLETKGGVFTPLIYRGAPVPCQRTEVFTTADDFQEVIQVRVFQGEDGRLVVPEQRLGNYEVRLLERAPRGVPAIHVTFQVDTTGTFRLTAKDAAGRDVPVAKLG